MIFCCWYIRRMRKSSFNIYLLKTLLLSETKSFSFKNKFSLCFAVVWEANSFISILVCRFIILRSAGSRARVISGSGKVVFAVGGRRRMCVNIVTAEFTTCCRSFFFALMTDWPNPLWYPPNLRIFYVRFLSFIEEGSESNTYFLIIKLN